MSPIPTFIPHTPADYQQIQLIQQVHNHTLPLWNMYLLSLLLPLPVIPIEWKLGIYNFLAYIPVLSSLHLSSFWFGLLMLLGPLGIVLILALFIFLSVVITKNVISPFLSLLLGRLGVNPGSEEKTFLELTFPSDTTKSAFATEQLYVLLHTRARMTGGWQSFLKQKKVFSLEIVSSRNEGIRFLLGVPKKEADVIHRSLLPFLPGLKVKEVADYLPKALENENDGDTSDTDESVGKTVSIAELKLSADFVLPLKSQKALSEHDPISYLIGQMTKLKDGELVAFQVVTTPILSSIQGRVIKRKREMMNRISQGLPLTPVLGKNSLFPSRPSFWWLLIGLPMWIGIFVFKASIAFIYAIIAPNSPSNPINQPSKASEKHLQMLLNPYEQELGAIVKEKLDQHLFETSIRILVASVDEDEAESRADELVSSFGQFSSSQQSLEEKGTFPFLSSFALKQRLSQFKNRGLSSSNPILSSSEIADLYHFPYTDITKTEGLVKSRSRELPAPLSLKKGSTKFDVLVGVNQYGGELSPIGLTLQRLLTDKKYQKEVAATLKDPVLKQFWQKEFVLMGNMQLSAVTAPLTHRLGYFISSKMSRHILLQEHSTISIQQIMDEGKILLINLSKGDLGEDQSFFFGTILTSLIWMAAYQRTKIPESKRRDFFVYIDEFQNFATPQFAEITSEGRKFRVSLITSHQNIAQIKDKDTLKMVAGNAHIIICTKASPDDEAFILPFMDPEVEKRDIVNLAPYHFFMKVTTDESEDAFSGKTVPVDVENSDKTKDDIINYTRRHYTTPRVKVEEYLEKLFAEDKPKKKVKPKPTPKNDNSKVIKPKSIMAKKPKRRK